MKASFLLSFVCMVLIQTAPAQTAKDYAVPLQAIVSESPLSIQLKWPSDTVGSGYTVYRKTTDTSSWGTAIKTLPISATTYTDLAVQLGEQYEYYVQRTYTDPKKIAHGYINTAIRKKAIFQRGGLLVLVDETYAIALKTEIDELILDLLKDGWAVTSQTLSRNASPTAVKSVIQTAYAKNSNKSNSYALKTVFILGHLAVPYSGGFVAQQGNIYPPDGHEDHGGAWATDMYYGSLDETLWTDQLVNDITPARPENKNIPGDGKFDLMYLGDAPLTLEVGRVDLTNLPAFGLNDTELTKQYLQKLHAYKTVQTPAVRAGLIDDNLKVLEGEAFAAATWNDFTTFFGDSVFERDYVTDGRQQPYLFTAGIGFGNYSTCFGVVNTNQFASDSIQQFFTLLFGSYFGDWDSQNNLLRAALGSKKGGLASAWSGRPYWHLHHMALGKHIGFSTRLTQNNYFTKGAIPSGYAHNNSPTFIDVNLMGDPTLRLHMREPMLPITATSAADSITITLSWPAMPNAVGYYIGKTSSFEYGFPSGVQLPANATSWTDARPIFGYCKYMVRPIYLEQTPSGSYYNLGLGAIDSAYSKNIVGLSDVMHNENIPATIYPNPNNGQFTISINEAVNASINITDIQGKGVLSKTINSSSENINVSSLTKGCYFITIKTGSGQITKKLIIN